MSSRTLTFLLLAAIAAPVAGRRLDSGTASSGLREALEVGTLRAVDELGRPDGFLRRAPAQGLREQAGEEGAAAVK